VLARPLDCRSPRVAAVADHHRDAMSPKKAVWRVKQSWDLWESDHPIDTPKVATLGDQESWYCDVCDMRLNGPEQLEEHQGGTTHDRREATRLENIRQKHARKCAAWQPKQGYPAQHQTGARKGRGDGPLPEPRDRESAARLELGGLHKGDRKLKVVSGLNLDAPSGARYFFACTPSLDPPSQLPLTRIGGHIKWASPGMDASVASSSDSNPRTPPQTGNNSSEIITQRLKGQCKGNSQSIRSRGSSSIAVAAYSPVEANVTCST
jgi:hypothetical protein